MSCSTSVCDSDVQHEEGAEVLTGRRSSHTHMHGSVTCQQRYDVGRMLQRRQRNRMRQSGVIAPRSDDASGIPSMPFPETQEGARAENT
jgi:hypothetical protein